jgi:hypothetical protein
VEGVDGRQEQEVENGHADQRDEQREAQPPERGHGQDRKEVEDAQAEHGRDRPKRVDRARHEHDDAQAPEHRDDTTFPGAHALRIRAEAP